VLCAAGNFTQELDTLSASLQSQIKAAAAAAKLETGAVHKEVQDLKPTILSKDAITGLIAGEVGKADQALQAALGAAVERLDKQDAALTKTQAELNAAVTKAVDDLKAGRCCGARIQPPFKCFNLDSLCDMCRSNDRSEGARGGREVEQPGQS